MPAQESQDTETDTAAAAAADEMCDEDMNPAADNTEQTETTTSNDHHVTDDDVDVEQSVRQNQPTEPETTPTPGNTCLVIDVMLQFCSLSLGVLGPFFYQ